MHLFWTLTVLLLGRPGPAPGAHAPGQRAVDVELLVYSGRENPRWELTESEVDELVRRVRELPPGPPPPEPPGLGYNGLQITASDGTAGLPETMTVYRGGVLIGPGGAGGVRRDERGLEQWLLGLARRRTYGEVLDSLGL
jgi:hypothetical protein